MKRIFSLIIIQILAITIFAQTEILTNKDVILMTQSGLSVDLIVRKIKETKGIYDVSARNLIELKKAGVDDSVIDTMMEKAEKSNLKTDEQFSNSQLPIASNNTNSNESVSKERIVLSAKEALRNAKTIAIEKSSLNPSRQELEKALLKRADWRKFNLNIVRLKEDADLYIEIGFVPFTILSHRYVFRIYDRQSGTILTAGETTSWGNLSKNLAREIMQKLNSVSSN